MRAKRNNIITNEVTYARNRYSDNKSPNLYDAAVDLFKVRRFDVVYKPPNALAVLLHKIKNCTREQYETLFILRIFCDFEGGARY